MLNDQLTATKQLNTDGISVAEGAAGGASMPHAPRFEPSWWWEGVPEALVEHALRRPTVPTAACALDSRDREWLHKHVVTFGHEANGRAHHYVAHAWFVCAFRSVRIALSPHCDLIDQIPI